VVGGYVKSKGWKRCKVREVSGGVVRGVVLCGRKSSTVLGDKSIIFTRGKKRRPFFKGIGGNHGKKKGSHNKESPVRGKAKRQLKKRGMSIR